MLDKEKLNSLSASALSFVGDAVFSLFVRERLCAVYDYKSGELTKKAAFIVSACNQSAILGRIEGLLTEEELAVVRRCRNAYSKTGAKNASAAEYHRASGLEGLLGYLHLAGESERLGIVLGECVCTERV